MLTTFMILLTFTIAASICAAIMIPRTIRRREEEAARKAAAEEREWILGQIGGLLEYAGEAKNHRGMPDNARHFMRNLQNIAAYDSSPDSCPATANIRTNDILTHIKEVMGIFDGRAAAKGVEFTLTSRSTECFLPVDDVLFDRMLFYLLSLCMRNAPQYGRVGVDVITTADDSTLIEVFHSGGDSGESSEAGWAEAIMKLHSGGFSRRNENGQETFSMTFSNSRDLGGVHVPNFSEKSFPGADSVRNDNPFVAKVTSLIDENIANTDFNVEEMARLMGISRIHVNRKLKELAGTSPNALIREMRMKKAIELLKEGRTNISEIASLTGFSTHSYFSSSFRDYYGITPKEYAAKLHRADQ